MQFYVYHQVFLFVQGSIVINGIKENVLVYKLLDAPMITLLYYRTHPRIQGTAWKRSVSTL